jgi:hypothetical protein
MALTGKQEAFAQAVASGSTQSDAYRQAYDVSLSCLPETIYENASKLAADANVSPRIQELKAQYQAAVVEQHAWTLNKLVSQAEKHMGVALEDHPRRGPNVSAANGALEIIGRVTGLLSDKPRQDQAVVITRITVVLDHGKDAEGRERIIEGEVIELTQETDARDDPASAPAGG